MILDQVFYRAVTDSQNLTFGKRIADTLFPVTTYESFVSKPSHIYRTTNAGRDWIDITDKLDNEMIRKGSFSVKNTRKSTLHDLCKTKIGSSNISGRFFPSYYGRQQSPNWICRRFGNLCNQRQRSQLEAKESAL